MPRFEITSHLFYFLLQNSILIVLHVTMQNSYYYKIILMIKDPVYRLAYSLLLDRQFAEDIYQEVAIKLWEIRNRLHAIDNIKAYALKIARNMCLNTLKKDKSQLALIQNNQETNIMDARIQFEHKEKLQLVFAAIKKLPEMQRTVLILRTIEGLTFEEISRITGVTTVNVRMLLSRARKYLRTHYEALTHENK